MDIGLKENAHIKYNFNNKKQNNKLKYARYEHELLLGLV